MESRQIGGVLLATTSVVAPTVADMMGLTLPPLLGWPLLFLCAVLFCAGVWLAWPRTKRPAGQVPLVLATPEKAKVRTSTLRGGYLLKPDATIREALDFVVTGSWASAGYDGPSYLAALGKALQDFHQIAANGQIRVWYKGYKDGVWEILGKSAFIAHKIEILDLLNDGELVMRRRRDGTVIETCSALRVNRDQIEDHWPVYSALLPG